MAKVRIEREVCTGSGECARSVPDVFWMGDDGLAMVQEVAVHFGETRQMPEEDGFTAWARVPDALVEAVELAAANCPGMCIVVEREAPVPVAEPEPTPEAGTAVDDAPAAPASRSSILQRIKYRLRHLGG